jgi:hypothetical protein
MHRNKGKYCFCTVHCGEVWHDFFIIGLKYPCLSCHRKFYNLSYPCINWLKIFSLQNDRLVKIWYEDLKGVYFILFIYFLFFKLLFFPVILVFHQ